MSRIKNKSEILTSKYFLLVAGIFIVCSFVIFGNGIKGDFVYDDTWVIGRNPTVSDFGQVAHQFARPYHYHQPESGLYRPLTIASYSFNFLFGKSPAGFHVFNILLHALNSFLVFVLLYELFKSKKLAWTASLLFLVLPIHVEAVTFISGRSDLLAFALSVFCLLFYSKKRYLASAVFFMFALFAKESAIALIPVIAVWMLWFEKLPVLSSLKRSLYYVPFGVVYLIFRAIALGEYFLANDATSIYNPIKFAGFFEKIFTSFHVFSLYLWKTFIPINLSADYSFNQIPLVQNPLDLGFLVGAIAILWLVYLIYKKRSSDSVLAIGALLFLGGYSIVSNLFFSIGTIMAERTFYLPSLGLVILVSWLLLRMKEFSRFSRIADVVFVVILVVYSVVAFNRNLAWRDAETLFLDMTQSSSKSAHAKTTLGITYLKLGKWEQGRRVLTEAQEIARDHVPLLDAMGILAEHDQRFDDAEKLYLRALELRPHYATALSNLGRLYFMRGEYKKTADFFKSEMMYDPSATTVLVYAMSEAKLGNYDVAIKSIIDTFGENPKDTNLKFALGYAYYKKGDRDQADKYFKESKNPELSDEEFIKSLEKI